MWNDEVVGITWMVFILASGSLDKNVKTYNFFLKLEKRRKRFAKIVYSSDLIKQSRYLNGVISCLNKITD